MLTLVLFTFLVLSPWPLFFSYLLYYVATLDSSYNPLIYSRKIFYKHWIFLSCIIVLCGFLFVFRLSRMGREIDFLTIFYSFWELFTFLPHFQAYLLFLSLLIMGIFWFLLLSSVYTYIRRSLMVLYIYYDQYKFFRDFLTAFLMKRSKFYWYLEKRVRTFTENPKFLHYLYGIWPLFPELVERNLFRFLVPYLYIFDICVKNGMVSLVFYVLPWMFLYSLIRSFYKLFLNIFRLQLFHVTIFFYGLDTDPKYY